MHIEYIPYLSKSNSKRLGIIVAKFRVLEEPYKSKELHSQKPNQHS
jgi:hypothetical protein